ncbi:MAG: hypothetical protein JSV32_01420 [Dehalococcoidia bacterium]|nr:MAG: hypothetical protein JSV32_01420 [Dehalococcoidia bacterium]
MNWRPFYVLLLFIFIALIVGLLGLFSQSLELKLTTTAGSLALLSVGLAINSFLISLNTERRINEVSANLKRIEELQIELQREHKEHQEQSSSGSMIIPTLETFTKSYLDYLDKQKGEGEEQDNTGGSENQKE